MIVCSPVAFAQKATPSPDMRCLIVGSRISGDPDPTKQAVGRAILMYYLGRLDESFPSLDIEEAIAIEEAKMSASDVQSETKRCSRWLLDRSQVLEKIGKDLLRRQTKTPPRS